MRAQAFINYVFSFYGGPHGLYASFFGSGVTKKEIARAHRIRLKLDLPFVGDSFDREMVRDIMLKIRGESKAEYDLSQIAGLIECERLKSKTRKSKSHE